MTLLYISSYVYSYGAAIPLAIAIYRAMQQGIQVYIALTCMHALSTVYAGSSCW